MTTPPDGGQGDEHPPDGDGQGPPLTPPPSAMGPAPGQPHDPWSQAEQQPAWSLPPPGSAGPVGSYRAPTNGLAVGSLIASIVGLVTTCLCGIGVIGAIIGVVMGPMARNQIRQSGGQQTGDGLALGGIIVGWIAIGLTALWIAFFLFGMLGSLIPMGGW